MIKQYHNRWAYCQKAPDICEGASEDINACIVTCCPDACAFYVSNNSSTYFGFDDKTNLANGSEYWFHNAQKKYEHIPQGELDVALKPFAERDKMIRDGSSWISIPANQKNASFIHTAEIDVQMYSQFNKICNTANIEFKALDEMIASISTSRYKDSGDYKITVTGNKPGETSIIAICNNRIIGWLHVWCDNIVVHKVELITVTCDSNKKNVPKEQRIEAFNYDFDKVSKHMNDTYRQSLIQFEFTESVFDISKNTQAKHFLFHASNSIIDKQGTIRTETSVDGYNGKQWLENIEKFIDLIPSEKNKKIIFLKPYQNHKEQGGIARGIGKNGCLIYKNDGNYDRITAHEYGHLLNLMHPDDTDLADKLPESFNKEQYRNVMKADGNNLMVPRNGGIGKLRYHQWKIIRKQDV